MTIADPPPARQGSRRTSRVARTIVVVGLLVLAAVVTVVAPTEDEIQAPLENHGTVGEVVSSRQASVEVTGVTVARAVDLGDGTPEVLTDGAWVAVEMTATCRLRTCDYADSLLRIGGRSYEASTLLGIPSFASLAAEAGVPYETTALFEIPREALADGRAELVVQPDRTAALDSRAVVDLVLEQTASGTAPIRPTRMVGTS